MQTARVHKPKMCYFLNLKSPPTKPSTPTFYGSTVVVAKQRSRSKQDQHVFLSGYNPGLALKQKKIEESTGADFVSAVNVRSNAAAARPETLLNSQNYSIITPQPMI